MTPVTVEVAADGAGLVSHAGTALVAQVADKVGLTQALSTRLAAVKQRRRGHDPGRVIRDLAVMLVEAASASRISVRSVSRTRCSGRWRLIDSVSDGRPDRVDTGAVGRGACCARAGPGAVLGVARCA